MPNPVRQIIGSFEDIGKDVLKQTAQVPQDIVGKAIENLGTSSSPKTQPIVKAQDKQDGALVTTKAIARAALEQLAAPPKQKEPTVWEKMQQETEQRKEQQKQQVQQQAQALPQAKGKRPRGDLYGLKAKRAAAEMSRNVRQD